VIVLAGCGESGASKQEASFLGRACAIEIGIDRDAKQSDIAAFTRRLHATAHIDRVELVSRERLIELFKRALRENGFHGNRYEKLSERAERYAGPTLIAIPDDSKNVPLIVAYLEELPASVTSVVDRPSCEAG
jgi:hypothetical protein